MRIAIRSFLLLLCILGILRAQDVYLPSRHEVYPFLKRMEARQLLKNYRDAAKPLTRSEIASLLKTLDTSRTIMTEVERESFDFFREEFARELSLPEGGNDKTTNREHLLELPLREGIMFVDPNVQLNGKTHSDGEVYVWSYGLKTYGNIADVVGFYFNYVSSREGGSARDAVKQRTPEPGVVLQRGRLTFFEYNTTEAQLTFGWKDIRLSLEKMQNVWGTGRRGSLILSDKAPSYPQIKVRVALAEWMDFIYLHGELHSAVVDSARSYQANSSLVRDFYRTVYRTKYIAAHQFEITPMKGLDFSLGESIIYSDRGPQFIYLIPIMLFKSAEHYNRDTDNAQIFASLDVNMIRNVNAYLSVFIDEINTEKLFDALESRNQAGFTAGVQMYDLGLENSELLVEYTRLNPWTYTHKFPAAAFTNNGYDLGHWTGQNADHLYLELAYRPTRPLRVAGFFERQRNGGLADIAAQYTLPSKPFLYGPISRVKSVGFLCDYQFIRDGFLSGALRWNSIDNEESPAKNRNGQLEASLSVKYGIW